jgi:hypothetical protein
LQILKFGLPVLVPPFPVLERLDDYAPSVTTLLERSRSAADALRETNGTVVA